MAKVISVNRSDSKGVVKIPQTEGLFIEDFGLEKDAHAGKWHRQVSLLAEESIEKMKKEIPGLKEGDFAENITSKGIILHKLPIGTRLKIGQSIQEVSQIGKTCHKGCAIKTKVGSCIMPSEGIFTRVIVGGLVRVGDPIEILENEEKI
ncbi:MAG: MOSC domain-containing protein [Anaerococcus sp.]|nr:MOSC domain-containing protein [Anaerococcus sp.]